MAGVDPEWTRRKWTYTDGTHGWLRNGKLIRWQKLWKSWFDEDKEKGKWPPQDQAKKGAAEKPRALWQIEQEIKITEAAIDADPIHNRCMGQVFTAEETAEHAAMLKKLDALEKEKKAALSAP
jgi:hypothetical protein